MAGMARGVPLPQWGLLRGRLACWVAPRHGHAAVHRRLQLREFPRTHSHSALLHLFHCLISFLASTHEYWTGIAEHQRSCIEIALFPLVH